MAETVRRGSTKTMRAADGGPFAATARETLSPSGRGMSQTAAWTGRGGVGSAAWVLEIRSVILPCVSTSWSA